MQPTTFLTTIVLLSTAVGCSGSPTAQLEANKDLVRRFAEASNAQDWEAVAALLTDDFTRHSAATPGPPVTSPDQFIELQQSFAVTSADAQSTPQEIIAEGDYVATLATYSGTQTGPMGDFPATGNAFEIPFLALFRIEDGKIAELWVEWDNMAMLNQLGLFPPQAPPGN